MSIITFFQNINIAYSIPIIIFVMGAIPWGILCYIKVYKLFCNKPVLEIIYDNGKFNREDILVKHNYLRKYYVCIIAIFNKSTKTVSSVRVFMETKGTPQITLLHFDTNKNMCDINPGATELFKVGELTVNFTNTKIKITASGDNILPSEKEIVL